MVRLDLMVNQVLWVHLVLQAHQAWDLRGGILVTQAILQCQEHKACRGTLDLQESQEPQVHQD